VPGIVGTKSLACHAERLAGVSGKDGIDVAAQGAGVKGGEVVPDRGGGDVSGALCGNENVAGVGFPFHKAAGVEAGFREHEAHIQSSAA
jgi:hypothetical protein